VALLLDLKIFMNMLLADLYDIIHKIKDATEDPLPIDLSDNTNNKTKVVLFLEKLSDIDTAKETYEFLKTHIAIDESDDDSVNIEVEESEFLEVFVTLKGIVDNMDALLINLFDGLSPAIREATTRHLRTRVIRTSSGSSSGPAPGSGPGSGPAPGPPLIPPSPPLNLITYNVLANETTKYHKDGINNETDPVKDKRYTTIVDYFKDTTYDYDVLCIQECDPELFNRIKGIKNSDGSFKYEGIGIKLSWGAVIFYNKTTCKSHNGTHEIKSLSYLNYGTLTEIQTNIGEQYEIASIHRNS
jgi:hypothetical protein